MVIPQLSDADLLKIYKDGEQRYKEKIPPGYQDVKKEGNKKYGDLIIWNEMINYSKLIKKDILFITDDTKEDWVLRLNGISLDPRKELLVEFKQKSEQLFYLLSSSNFIDQFSK